MKDIETNKPLKELIYGVAYGLLIGFALTFLGSLIYWYNNHF